jgi:hypothetical protein
MPGQVVAARLRAEPMRPFWVQFSLAPGVPGAAKRRLPPAWGKPGGVSALTARALRVVSAYRPAGATARLGGIAAARGIGPQQTAVGCRSRYGRQGPTQSGLASAPELRTGAQEGGPSAGGSRYLGRELSELFRQVCPYRRGAHITSRCQSNSGLYRTREFSRILLDRSLRRNQRIRKMGGW